MLTRRFVAGVVAASAAAMLTACGSSDSSSVDPSWKRSIRTRPEPSAYDVCTPPVTSCHSAIWIQPSGAWS